MKGLVLILFAISTLAVHAHIGDSPSEIAASLGQPVYIEKAEPFPPIEVYQVYAKSGFIFRVGFIGAFAESVEIFKRDHQAFADGDIPLALSLGVKDCPWREVTSLTPSKVRLYCPEGEPKKDNNAGYNIEARVITFDSPVYWEHFPK